MQRQIHLENIIRSLGGLCSQVRLCSSLNLNNLSIHCENFYRDLLNLVYGYNLKNINIDVANVDTVDLGDDHVPIAIQVTATAALSKTRKTVDAFSEKGHARTYKRLVMLIITEKAARRDDEIKSKDGGYVLDVENDIWSIETILKSIQQKPTEDIITISSFLSKELANLHPDYVSREIDTFLNLVYLLSEQDGNSDGKSYIDDPDPEGKIRKRFVDHAPFLEEIYKDLYIEYGRALSDSLESSKLGQPRIRRLGIHLKVESDTILTKHNGNARDALEDLVKTYCGYLAKRSSSFDVGAVRFFLVDQLIRCNVFPNKEAVHG